MYTYNIFTTHNSYEVAESSMTSQLVRCKELYIYCSRRYPSETKKKKEKKTKKKNERFLKRTVQPWK